MGALRHRGGLALLRGDRAGWLAAVDPADKALRTRFGGLFRALRALRVTEFRYDLEPTEPAGGSLVTNVGIDFCLGRPRCPDPARTSQRLTFRADRTGYLITRMATGDEDRRSPWVDGNLVFAEGRRVTVAAPPALRRRLAEAVRVGDKAAAVADRIARQMGNRQERYRIFLADDKAWKRWYGGHMPRYSVAYTIRLDESGSDVVLHMGRLGDRRELAITTQHELTREPNDRDDLWLMEGVAEYAGWLPLRAGRDIVMPALRERFRGANRPRSMVQPAIEDSTSQRTVETFYSLGNYAVACLVTKYGDSRAMTFVRQRLRTGESLDTASRTAFGKPFAAVDRSCVNWIGTHLG